MRLSKRIFTLLCLAPWLSAHALSVQDIIRRLESQPPMDTLNMRVSISVQGGGFVSNSQIHLITKGSDKSWLETENAAFHQRIVKNGPKYQVTDLKTGRKETPPVPPDIGVPATTQTANIGLLKSGSYEAPQEVGSGLYRLRLVPGTDTTVQSRELNFDAGSGQIVRIYEIGTKADTTITTLDYTGGSDLPVPTTLTVETHGPGRIVTVRMRFLNVVKPGSISEKLFEIN